MQLSGRPINWTIVNSANDNYVTISGYPASTKYIVVKVAGTEMLRTYVSGPSTIIKLQDIYRAYWLRRYSGTSPMAGIGIRESWIFFAKTRFEAIDDGGSVVNSWDWNATPVGNWIKTRYENVFAPYHINGWLKYYENRYGFAWRRPASKGRHYPFSVGIGTNKNDKVQLVNNGTTLYESGALQFSGYDFVLSDGDNDESGALDREHIKVIDSNNNTRWDISGIRQECSGDVYLRWYAPPIYGYKYGFFDVVKIEYSGQTNEWEGLTFDTMINGLLPKVSAKMVVRKVMRDDFDRMYFADFLRSPMMWMWDVDAGRYYNVRHETLQWQEVERNEIIATIKIPAKWW